MSIVTKLRRRRRGFFAGSGFGAGGGGSAIVEDSFDRDDTAVALGNADTLQAWSDPLGVFGIASNRAYPVSGAGAMIAILDSTVADGTITVTLPVTDAGEFSGLTFRYSATTDYWDIALDATTLYLQKVEGGSGSTVDSGAIVLANGGEVKVVLDGATIEAYYDDVLIASASSAFNASATNHGLFTFNGVNTRWDDFSVTT